MFCYENKEVSSLNKVCLCGIGAAGANIVAEALPNLRADDFACAMDLDARRLNAATVANKIHLGSKLTKGLGSSGDMAIAQCAAEESAPAILRAIDGADLVVIACGLGGGTGSGVAPAVARLAKEQGAMVISIAVLPFNFEGSHRHNQATEALKQLSTYSDLVLRFCNDHIESLIDDEHGILGAFNMVNSLLARAMMLIPTTLRNEQSILHVGIDDLFSVVGTSTGICSFGVTELAHGSSFECLPGLLAKSPLFIDAHVEQLKEVLVLIQANSSLTIRELGSISSYLSQIFAPSVKMRLGVSLTAGENENISVSVLGVIPECFAPSSVIPVTPTVSAPIEPEQGEMTQASSSPQPEEVAELPHVEKDAELDELCPVNAPVIAEAPTEELAYIPTSAPSVEFEESTTNETEEEVPQSDDFSAPVDHTPIEEIAGTSYPDDASRGLFDTLKPNILDGEDLDLPPSLRKKR